MLTLPVSREVRSWCSFSVEEIKLFRHVQLDFWPGFCSSAGVFCIGEVFGDADVGLVQKYHSCFTSHRQIRPVATYQGPQGLDSVLNYPMYSALTSSFAIPGPQNMSAVVDFFQQSQRSFKVCLRTLYGVAYIFSGCRGPWKLFGKSRCTALA